MNQANPLPLDNIRVVDLTHVIAGPFSSYQLSVLGADVIKIESPTNPDMVRAVEDYFPHGSNGLGAFFRGQAANKRSLSVDISTPQGRDIVLELMDQADVVVENFRCGALAKHGLDYASVKARNPRLIYCSITGFGQNGPKSDHTAYDNVIQAFSGLMSACGDTSTSPSKIGPPVLDYATGLQAAFAISAALYQRERTGLGDSIDVAMLDSALMLMCYDIVHLQQMDGLVPLSGNSSLGNAGYACYDTLDGKLMIGAYTAAQCHRMWCVLGDASYGEQFIGHQPPVFEATVQQDRQRIQAILMQAKAAQWEDLFNEAKVPAARVRKLNETLEEPQIAARSLLQRATKGEDEAVSDLDTDRSTDQIRYASTAFRYQNATPSVRRPPPEFAQHSREILLELGYQESQIAELAATGIISCHANKD